MGRPITCTSLYIWLRRLWDAEYARQRWGAEHLLCCPIPVSLGAAIAQLPLEEEAGANPGAPEVHTALGVVTVGLQRGTAATAECASSQSAMHYFPAQADSTACCLGGIGSFSSGHEGLMNYPMHMCWGDF